MSRALGEHATVTVACNVPEPAMMDGICLVPGGRRRLLRLARTHDVVLAPWLQPFLFPALARSSAVLIADLYDPSELELVHKADSPQLRREIEAVVRLTRIQERFSDVLLAGGERQAAALMADLRAGPQDAVPPYVQVVPFGLAPPPQVSARGTLRGALPGVGAEDPLILWWGSIWRWLDPETAIRAAAILARDRPRIRLVFTSGRPGRADYERAHRHGAGTRARASARSPRHRRALLRPLGPVCVARRGPRRRGRRAHAPPRSSRGAPRRAGPIPRLPLVWPALRAGRGGRAGRRALGGRRRAYGADRRSTCRRPGIARDARTGPGRDGAKRRGHPGSVPELGIGGGTGA